MKKILLSALLFISSFTATASNDDFFAIIYIENKSTNETIKVTGPYVNGAYVVPRSSIAPRLRPPFFPATYKFEGDDGQEFILEMDKGFEIKECAQSVYEVNFIGWRNPEPVLVLSRRCVKYYDGFILGRLFN